MYHDKKCKKHGTVGCRTCTVEAINRRDDSGMDLFSTVMAAATVSSLMDSTPSTSSDSSNDTSSFGGFDGGDSGGGGASGDF